MRASLVLLLALSSPARADITASEVWAEMQRQAAVAGLLLSADVRQLGRDLVLDRPKLHLSADGATALRLDRLVLRETADGSVAVLLPDRFPITLDLPPGALPTDPRTLTFSAAVPGLEIEVDDLGTDAAFRVNAPSASLALDPGAFAPGEDASLTLALADLTLTHRQRLGATGSTVDTRLTLGTLHADGLIAVRGGERASASIDLSALVGRAVIDIDPSQLQDPMATVRQLLSGMDTDHRIDLLLEHGPIAATFTLVDDLPGPEDVRIASDAGRASLQADQTGIAAEVTTTGVRLAAVLDDPEVPFRDLDLGYQELALGASLGISKAIAAEDYAVFARMEGLTLAEAVWAAFDPDAVFPRDPMTAALALSGQMVEKPLTAELAFGDAAPVDVLSMSLDDLRLSGLGVDLTGTGALTFDNSDLVTFDGAPAPEGTLAFAATGITALLDKAAAAGMIPIEELTGLRFGLAFIAKPDAADPDSLTSRIEFRDKSLYLNGIKLR
jgi:hypothetical protein